MQLEIDSKILVLIKKLKVKRLQLCCYYILNLSSAVITSELDRDSVLLTWFDGNSLRTHMYTVHAVKLRQCQT